MAIPSWDRELNTMVTTALDTMTKDPINVLTDSGEKFLGAAASLGRVFVVNDAESIRHPVLYDHGENSTLYYPDEIDGAPTTNSLSATAKEWASRARNVEEMKPTTGKRADLAKVDKAATKRWAARKDEREARHARLMQRVDRLKGTK